MLLRNELTTRKNNNYICATRLNCLPNTRVRNPAAALHLKAMQVGDRAFFYHSGKPKAIVHCHGGLLLEQLKSQGLMWDLRDGDRLLWFSTTAWMLWNTVISALLHGAAAVLIDGNPLYPDLRQQWRWAEETGATLIGLSPGFVMACRKDGLEPAREFDLRAVRQVGVAGAPLPVAVDPQKRAPGRAAQAGGPAGAGPEGAAGGPARRQGRVFPGPRAGGTGPGQQAQGRLVQGGG